MNSSRRIDGVIVGLHLRWRGVWQRPNHIISRLGRDLPVIVLEEPELARSNADVTERSGNITIVTPHRTSRTGEVIDDAALRAVRSLTAQMHHPLIWLYSPMMLPLADAFPAAPIVYDKMDELAAFAAADPRLPSFESALLARAALVFAGGRSLYAGVHERAAHVRLFASGVDAAHFERPAATAFDELEPAYAGRPIFGYVGVIDERIDLDLIAGLADAYPQAAIVLVGPVTKVAPSALPQRPNIAYYGPARYDDLPELLACFSVALMPFALNRHTANISPTKTLEYLAAGLPVVSTAVPDVVADHAQTVTIAADRDAFIAAVGSARLDDELRTSARAAVRKGSWDTIVSGMQAELRACGLELV